MTAPLSSDRLALLRAADYIDKVGWCKHKQVNYRGAVCAVQAIWSVGATHVYYHAVSRFRAHVGDSPTRWNDEKGRTQQQVTAALRAAAMEGL